MWAMRRFRPKSTLLSGPQIAPCSVTKARTSFGLRCIVKTLFGTKPSDLKNESNWSFSSGVCSGGSGSRRPMPLPHVLQQQQQSADHRDVGDHAVLHADA